MKQNGTMLKIDENRVVEVAGEIEQTFRKNEIGNYYKEAIWDLLSESEQRLLTWLGRQERQGCFERELAPEQQEALTNLVNLGILGVADGRLYLTADLFRAWLWRRDNPGGTPSA